MAFGRDSHWAEQLIQAQLPDGSWGPFHSMAKGSSLTTERALRRLEYLGFTGEDEVIRRALDYIRTCREGTSVIPDRVEVTHDWGLFTSMMFSAWLRRYTDSDEPANAFALRWKRVLETAFASGAYSDSSYRAAYEAEFGLRPRGARFVSFVSFYQVSLLANLLSPEAEQAMFEYLLHCEEGIYYIYGKPVRTPPQVFASRETVQWLMAVELLARYTRCRGQLAFATDYLLAHQEPDGCWDLSPAAKDGIALPLSDSWRKPEDRRRDCTDWISRILNTIQN